MKGYGVSGPANTITDAQQIGQCDGCPPHIKHICRSPHNSSRSPHNSNEACLGKMWWLDFGDGLPNIRYTTIIRRHRSRSSRMSMTSDVFLVEYPDERVAAYYVYEWDYRTFKVSPIGFTTEEPTLTKMAFMALASDRSRKRLRNELKELTCQHTTT